MTVAVEHQPLREIVAERIREMIIAGEFAPGERLVEGHIAELLQVSRNPVREAIRQLDAEGYVTIRPNRGAVVTAREREQVVELFEIRGALEGLAMRLAAARVDEEALADLEIELARLRNVAADSARWLERHDEFHDRLCRAANRPQLEVECRRYRLAVRPYVRLYLKSGRTFEQICRAVRRKAFRRALREGVKRVAEEDMHAAVNETLDRLATALTPQSIRAYIDDLPQDDDVVSVNLVHRPVKRDYEYVLPTQVA